MENYLKLATSHSDTFGTIIEIDNSTDYKDFTIVKTDKTLNENNDANQATQFQLSKQRGGELTLEIQGFTLIGREVELLKEFLNQI